MQVFTIQSNIPVPTTQRRRGKPKYPWPLMQVGDSFLAPHTRVTMSAYAYGKRHNMKFVSLKEANGIRVWRTE
jgi:hypothetical protein